MKKLSIIAIVATTLGLASCGGNSSNVEKKGVAETEIKTNLPVVQPEKGGIVYVRIDSVINNFDMYHDLRRTYEEDVTKANTDLMAKAKVFQKDASNLQEKYQKGLITRSEAEAEGDRLSKRQHDLEEEQNKVRNELGEKEMVLLNKINQAILDFIKTYNEEKGYSLIISTTGNSTVLYGNPGLDISTDIIKGLNQQYSKNKSK